MHHNDSSAGAGVAGLVVMLLLIAGVVMFVKRRPSRARAAVFDYSVPQIPAQASAQEAPEPASSKRI